MALYAEAYGVPGATLSKWLADFERERRTPEVMKRFRVTAKQWDEWTWHERVKAIEADFNPGRTRREAFEDVKGWLAHYSFPIDTDVLKIALEHFDEKAQARTKERLREQREERTRRLHEEKQNQQAELHRLNNRIQELTDLREREIENYENRIRALESLIETPTASASEPNAVTVLKQIAGERSPSLHRMSPSEAKYLLDLLEGQGKAS